MYKIYMYLEPVSGMQRQSCGVPALLVKEVVEPCKNKIQKQGEKKEKERNYWEHLGILTGCRSDRSKHILRALTFQLQTFQNVHAPLRSNAVSVLSAVFDRGQESCTPDHWR